MVIPMLVVSLFSLCYIQCPANGFSNACGVIVYTATYNVLLMVFPMHVVSLFTLCYIQCPANGYPNACGVIVYTVLHTMSC